jgi:hypothetical protein
MGRVVPPLPQYAFMAWCSVRGSTGMTFYFLPYEKYFAASTAYNKQKQNSQLLRHVQQPVVVEGI